MADERADVVELLTTDHARIAELIEAGDGRSVIPELAKHLVAEDQLVYPQLRAGANDDDRVDSWLDSDRRLEEALLEVDKGRRTDLAAVAELFASHRQTQEAETFPLMRAVLEPERLLVLGDELQEVMRTAPTHPHPHNPDEGILEVVTDAISARIDEIRDAYHEGKGDR